ncbi:MAG: MMPL family transporter, partial [Planctomycetes bacterium]|nr:MMPL family transporter [Planctomycetota bacterium]
LFTAITDVAGFASTFFSGIMPPLEWFGFFSAVGLGSVLLFTWTVIPSFLILSSAGLKLDQRLSRWSIEGPIAAWLRRLGLWCHDHPLVVLLAGAGAFALGAAGALQIRVNQSMGSAFREDHPIIQADKAINRLFHGTYFLDILIEGERPGDLLRPEVLEKIAAMELFAKTLPNVGGTVSVVGFAKKMNQILNRNDLKEYRIPDSSGAVRQNFDLIRLHSKTKLADLRRVVDDDYRVANARIRMKSGEYVDEAVVVENMQRFLERHFAGLPVRSSLAGRVNMDYHWMKLVLRSNLGNVALALGLVFGCMVVMFRSFLAGLYCLIPVAFAVLYTYGIMGFLKIDLSISTSMFAAIATGVGVDYPTHLLERLRVLIGFERAGSRQAFADAFGIAGKAVFYNAAAVSFGFLVLTISELPLLVRFGAMIGVGIGTACLASLTLLPALVRFFKPRFIFSPGGKPV